MNDHHAANFYRFSLPQNLLSDISSFMLNQMKFGYFQSCLTSLCAKTSFYVQEPTNIVCQGVYEF